MRLLQVERIVFFTLLFAIPLQTRVFLFTPAGFTSEWLSGHLYATDLLVAALFSLWGLRVFWHGGMARPHFDGVAWLAAAFAALGFLSVWWAADVPVAIYRSLKLAEYAGLFFYIVYARGVVSRRLMLMAFVAGGVAQAGLATAQFFLQRSVGLRFLGESVLTPITPGVAEVISDSTRFVRAYGTFSSPNVLAAYLGFAVLVLLWWYVSERRVSTWSTAGTAIALFILALGFIVAFSRTALAAYIGGMGAWFLLLVAVRGSWTPRVYKLLVMVLVVHAALALMFFPELHGRLFESGGLGQPAVVDRLLYNVVASDLIVEQPWGAGIGNFTRVFGMQYQSLPGYLYQPAHNIFLLVAVEMGVAALVVFAVFLARLAGSVARAAQRNRQLIPVAATALAGFVMIIIEGSFDHFFLTLQQGAFLLWVFLGLVYGESREGR
jgi:O-antigen ligase